MGPGSPLHALWGALLRVAGKDVHVYPPGIWGGAHWGSALRRPETAGGRCDEKARRTRAVVRQVPVALAALPLAGGRDGVRLRAPDGPPCHLGPSDVGFTPGTPQPEGGGDPAAGAAGDRRPRGGRGRARPTANPGEGDHRANHHLDRSVGHLPRCGPLAALVEAQLEMTALFKKTKEHQRSFWPNERMQLTGPASSRSMVQRPASRPGN